MALAFPLHTGRAGVAEVRQPFRGVIAVRHLLSSVVTSAIASLTAALGSVVIVASAVASEIDPASSVRGALGSSLDDLSFGTELGPLLIVLNGGCALVFAAFAGFALARRRRTKIRERRPLGDKQTQAPLISN